MDPFTYLRFNLGIKNKSISIDKITKGNIAAL